MQPTSLYFPPSTTSILCPLHIYLKHFYSPILYTK
jgi:hypothetical protein